VAEQVAIGNQLLTRGRTSAGKFRTERSLAGSVMRRAEREHPASHLAAAVIMYPQSRYDASSGVADDVHRSRVRILAYPISNLCQMLGLLPKIICTISNRFDDDDRTARRSQRIGQRLKRSTVASIARHQQNWTGICLWHRLNRVGYAADDADNCEGDDQ